MKLIRLGCLRIAGWLEDLGAAHSIHDREFVFASPGAPFLLPRRGYAARVARTAKPAVSPEAERESKF